MTTSLRSRTFILKKSSFPSLPSVNLNLIQRYEKKPYRDLPPDVRKLARKNYQLWREEPFYPSLNFKKIGGGK